MKIKSSSKQFAIALLLLTIFSCEDTTIVKNYTGTGEEKTYSIEGYAQKGPFIVGTDVTVSELSEDLYPTGRVFFATILNDEGYFELPGVVLASPYIQIKIRGRYFSETGGYVTNEELTLYSLADINQAETINVNLLTHLEKERVEHLVQEEDYSFEDAKEKAKEEILDTFEWSEFSVDNSENLDLTENNTGGAVLLAVSSIFENIEYVKRIETITNFKVDFREDGTLDTESIQNRLLTSAAMLSTETVREILETEYGGVTLSNFEELVQVFIQNSSYINYFELIFPAEADGKINLLRLTGSNLNSTHDYAIIVQSAPPELEFGILSKNFSYRCYFPDNPISSFNADSEFWLQTWDFNIDCAGLEFCNDKLYNMAEVGTIDYSIPVVKSGIGRLEFSFGFDIDGIFKTEYREITW